MRIANLGILLIAVLVLCSDLKYSQNHYRNATPAISPISQQLLLQIFCKLEILDDLHINTCMHAYNDHNHIDPILAYLHLHYIR